MKNVIMTIILFGLCVALVVGIVIPITHLIRETGGRSFDSVKTLSDNIVEETN